MLIISHHRACFVCVPKTGSQAVSAFLQNELCKDFSRFPEESMFNWHATLSEVDTLGHLPFSIYDLWSFAFVRNPFDRLISYCASFDVDFSLNPYVSIERALRAADAGDSRWLFPQTYMTQGVKTIYKFEALDKAIEELKVYFKLPADAQVPVINDSSHARYTKYFDGRLKEMVESIYSDDLKSFDYGF